MTDQQTHKTTKAIVISIMAATLVFGAASASADRDDYYDDQRYYEKDRYHKKDKYYKRDKYYKKGRYNHTNHYYGNERIKLDLPVRVRGSDRIRLRKLARQYYDIDLDHYRLVRVVVDGHGRRHRGTACLQVGHYLSDAKYLDGRTRFRAPNARRHAPWVLEVSKARVNNVRLVLEPRNRHAYKDRHHRDDWYAYRKHFRKYW